MLIRYDSRWQDTEPDPDIWDQLHEAVARGNQDIFVEGHAPSSPPDRQQALDLWDQLAEPVEAAGASVPQGQDKLLTMKCCAAFHEENEHYVLLYRLENDHWAASDTLGEEKAKVDTYTQSELFQLHEKKGLCASNLVLEV